MLLETLPVGPLGTNCYLLADEAAGLACVVDPGAEAERIIRTLRQKNYTPAMIALTHGHWDHTGAIAELLAAYPGVPVYIHPLDLKANSGDHDVCYAGAGESQRTYEDGDTLTVGALTLQVLHTPGHSLGSVTLLCGDRMFSGDTLFAGTCGRCDFYGGSLETMFASLKRLAQLEGDYIVYPGHGESTDLSVERRTNPYIRRAMTL